MIPLIGYIDRFSARPGERIDVKVSSRLDGLYSADLVHIVHADPNPAGSGMKMPEVSAPFAGAYPSRFQPTHPGSCGVVTPPNPLRLPEAATLCVRVQPWLLDGGPRTVLATRDGLVLSVTVDGAVLEIGETRCQVRAPILERRWYELRVILGATGARLIQRPLHSAFGDAGEAALPVRTDAISTIAFGAAFTAEAGPYRAFLNGRIEDPVILCGAHDAPAPLEPSALMGDIIAWWDFSADIATQRLTDRGPLGLDGRLCNLPTRAVRGSRWNGEEMNWRHMPRHYAAIHIHADDLYDCEWETDFAFEVPADMPSGVYGIRLRADDQQDIIPAYVLPPRGSARAPIAFLASTFTYQVYGNHARGNVRPRSRLGVPSAIGTVTATPCAPQLHHRTASRRRCV